MTTYSIKIVNDSSMASTFALFQNNPAGAGPSDPLSLAWFAAPIGLDAARPVTFDPKFSIDPVGTVSKPEIQPLSGVNPGEFSVGIGMSGAGTFVVPAQPNLTFTFTPHPTYWVISGRFETGNVIDVDDTSTRADIDHSTNVP